MSKNKNGKKNMKRYWLFGNDTYYSVGGMADFIASSDSRSDLIERANEIESTGKIDWWHVFDSREDKIVSESEYKPYGFEGYPDFRS